MDFVFGFNKTGRSGTESVILIFLQKPKEAF